MNKKEEEIQRKLLELESSVLKESHQEVIVTDSKRTDLTGVNSAKTSASANSATLTKNDGAYFAGMLSMILGVVMVFQHVRVGSSFLSMLMGGGGTVAVFLLPLLIGIGMMFFNFKSKWGRGLTALSILGLLLAILFTLNFQFPPLSMLQTLVMFLPFAIGGALVVKGMGGPKGVEEAIKQQIAQKDEG